MSGSAFDSPGGMESVRAKESYKSYEQISMPIAQRAEQEQIYSGQNELVESQRWFGSSGPKQLFKVKLVE